MAKGDDLTEITGIGPATVEKLNDEGITTFAQMAEWDEDEMDRLDVKLGLKGKIRTDDWRGQAKDKLGSVLISPKAAFGMEGWPSDGEATGWDAPDSDLAAGEDAPDAAPPKKPEPDIQTVPVPQPDIQTAPVPKQKGKQRRRLDRRKKVSDVYGNYRGAAFVQVLNGKQCYFTAGEVEMLDGEEASDAIAATEVPHEVKTWEDVHFLNYLDKKQDVPFPLLKQAIQHRYGRPVKNVKEAKMFLHESLRTNY